jgi:hypothetical protein
VDPAGVWLGALGIITNSLGAELTGTRLAAPVVGSIEYKVEVPPALFETHHGLVGLATNPHEFCKFLSSSGALPVLETRLVCV